MANRHIIWCWISLSIKEMQNETTRYHLMLIRMAIIKKSTDNKCCRGHGEKGTLLHGWWECKLVQPLWRTVWRFLKKLKIEFPYDTAIPLLEIYLEKTLIWKEVALLTIAKTWKQPRCPSTVKCIKNMLYIYTHIHIHKGILLSHKKE